jgi:predicted CXXCH cytochrome family protein
MKNPSWILSMALFLFHNEGMAQTCITGECHTDIDDKRIVHIPVEEEDCFACHRQVNRKHPKSRGADFVLTEATLEDLCRSCHELDTERSGLHNPVAEGMCLSCHDPHQSDAPYLLPGETTSAVCVQCHDTGTKDKRYTHGPVAVGACEVCHLSHGTKDNSLLSAEQTNTVCYDCHALKEMEITNYDQVHTPVEESCVNCHDPHESDHAYQLLDTTPDLCYSCHGEIETLAETMPSQHMALKQDRTCLNCHLPHGSDYQFNLKEPTFDLCLGCHDQPMKSGRVTLPSMKKLLEKNPDWHGPIRDKNCSGCHEPHGSQNIRLLRRNYPPEFYSAFNVENYQLCFQCHPETNVLDKNTAKLTNFRDGQRNLHYLHVNRPKGRTCRACHQTHASEHPYHIRDTVPFGKWFLPINYLPQENGGSCKPGCHKFKQYRR